jgi:hypothetical protein
LKVDFVIPSIGKLDNFKSFINSIEDCKYELLIIDEGDPAVREKNIKILGNVPHRFYGPKERNEWFKTRFGVKSKKFAKVIPEKCHAETSFGFLVCFEEKPDMVIELDDDVRMLNEHQIYSHLNNLCKNNCSVVSAKGKWYNTIENLSLTTENTLYPRGYPYHSDTRVKEYSWTNKESSCVLNMGMWIGTPDLDALTLTYKGCIDGKMNLQGECKRKKVVVAKGTYFPICSMNTAFKPEIIPAFYQLYMKVMGIDRFDDIWSGVFLKKIADHIGDSISLGHPLVYHDKTPRNVFEDLKKELEGIIINEKLWKVLDKIDLEGKTYWDAYKDLIEGLEVKLHHFNNPLHYKFLTLQIEKMSLWLECIDKLM